MAGGTCDLLSATGLRGRIGRCVRCSDAAAVCADRCAPILPVVAAGDKFSIFVHPRVGCNPKRDSKLGRIIMKAMQVFALVMAMAYPTISLADTSVDSSQFGRMKGILSACSSVNPREASKYLLQIKTLIGDATKETVDQAARTEEYKQAYHDVTEELGSMNRDDMARACADYLAVTN